MSWAVNGHSDWVWCGDSGSRRFSAQSKSGSSGTVVLPLNTAESDRVSQFLECVKRNLRKQVFSDQKEGLRARTISRCKKPSVRASAKCHSIRLPYVFPLYLGDAVKQQDRASIDLDKLNVTW